MHLILRSNLNIKKRKVMVDTKQQQNIPPLPLFHANPASRPLLSSFMFSFDTHIANTLFSFEEDFPSPKVEINPSQDLFVEKFTMYSFQKK